MKLNFAIHDTKSSFLKLKKIIFKFQLQPQLSLMLFNYSVKPEKLMDHLVNSFKAKKCYIKSIEDFTQNQRNWLNTLKS